MSVVSVDKDYESLSVIVVAEFDAEPDAVWSLWADPRKLEGWWGPPGYPATFEQHDLSAGGEVTYYMTAPDGEKLHGWWKITSVDEPSTIEYRDGFGESPSNPASGMPSAAIRVTFKEQDGGTRMEMRSTYEEREHLQQVLDMGALEGVRASVEQMDAVLAA